MLIDYRSTRRTLAISPLAAPSNPRSPPNRRGTIWRPIRAIAAMGPARFARSPTSFLASVSNAAAAETQKAKPRVSIKWCVLNSSGGHVYNVMALTAGKAVQIAMQNYKRASADFRAEHDMESASAVPYDDFWTRDRLDALSA